MVALVALVMALGGVTASVVTADDDGDDNLNSVRLWSAIPITFSPGGTVIIASESVNLEFEAGDTAVLSSTPDGLGAFFTDNFIHINGTNVCTGGDGTSCFLSPLYTAIPPIDVSSFIPVGDDDDGPPVVFDLVDAGGLFASTDVYLVTTSDIGDDGDDDVLETVKLDTRLFGGFDQVLTANPLLNGVKYRITVEGNWSAWFPFQLEPNPCPLPFPVLFASPSVPAGTRAGVDFEYIFSAPGPGEPSHNLARCDLLDTSGPIPGGAGLFSLDAGANFFDPVPVDADFNADHRYEYIVTGTGQRAAFRNADNKGDDHGILKFTVELAGDDDDDGGSDD